MTFDYRKYSFNSDIVECKVYETDDEGNRKF